MLLFARAGLFVCLLGPVASLVAAITGADDNREPEDGANCEEQQFYFGPTGSCKNCSDLSSMFDNYGEWLRRQLRGQPTEPTGNNQSQPSPSSVGEIGNITRSPHVQSSGNHRSTDMIKSKEVSILKSSPRSSGYNYNGDVALSRLVLLGDHNSNPLDLDGYLDPESTSIGSQSPSSTYLDSSSSSSSSSPPSSSSLLSVSSDSSLDFIRGQTKQVTKFVSQFVRSNPVIGDQLFRVMEECKQNQNASACQMWSNLCVITMYAHSDTTMPTNQPDNHRNHRHHNNNDEQQLSSGSSPSNDYRRAKSPKQSSSPRKELNNNGGWQQCKQFTLTSICDGLREWHRLERKTTGLDNALQSIYATIDEPFGGPIGASGGSPASGLLLMRPDQQLQLLAYRYSFEGNLIGVDQFGPSEMEKFCLRSGWAAASFAGPKQHRSHWPLRLETGSSGYFRFGKNMQLQACRLSELEAFQLLQEHQLNDTQFVDLYIAYPAGNSVLIKPVPILVKNLLYNGNLINQKYSKDSSRWRLVHRFFYHSLIATANLNPDQTGSDPQSRQGSDGSQTDEKDTDGRLSLLYAKSVVLDLKFRKLDKGAALSSILLTVDYGIVSRSFGELASSSSSATFRQNRSTTLKSPSLDDYLETNLLLEQSLIDMQAYKQDLDLAITILSILSSIWSLIKCYNIQKCRGNVKLDLESLIRFVIIGCDTVALLLMSVLFIFITYLFVYLKFQQSSVQVLAPNEQLESSLMLNVQLAFAFKLIGLAHKLYVHLNADIFFIDWERPKMLTSTQILNLSYQQHNQQIDEKVINKHEPGRPVFANPQQQQQQVSFWRPYTVINRWFQMQTLRRLDITVHLLAFVLIVHLSQATRLASADLSLYPLFPADDGADSTRRLVPCQSLVFRALILTFIYLSLAVCQIVYKKYFHEPWIGDPVREFVDLCSVANVSLFCWLYPRFGYYIHGRNANGSGDRGIGEMNALLEREERDLCSKRGLAPNSDQQTFVLILPKVINDHYRNLLSKEPTSLVRKLGLVASNQPIGKQLFNQPIGGNTINNGQQTGNGNSLLLSALNLSSSASLSGAGSSSQAMATGGQTFGCRGRIDSLVAKHKSIQQFLTNFLEHVYKDIDYAIREGRRFENLLLLDFDFDDEALVSMSGPGAGARSPNLQSNPATQPILANQRQQQQQQAQQLAHQAAATFCKDGQNSFTSLLWFGLELDLVLVELLSFLVLDLWLGQPPPLITASLLWLMHQTFRAIYISCSRYNLITKALLDEKFLFSA